LRHIRFGGVEVIRAISYIVRDKDWGTYSPAITELEIDSSPDRFEVSYSAAASEGATTFHFRASIVGTLMKSRSRRSADPKPDS
jgi:D-apionolactonase